MNRLRLTAIASSVLLAAGCSGLQKNIETAANDLEASATRLHKEVGKPNVARAAAEPVVYKESVFIGRSVIKIEPVETLPPAFSESAAMNHTVRDIREFAERVTIRTGMPVSVTPEAYTATIEAMNSVQGLGSTTGMVGLPPVPGGVPSNPQQAQFNGQYGTDLTSVHFIYPSGSSNGTLKGMLDTAAARYGVSWRFKDGEVQFYLTETRSFSIRAVPGSSKLDASVATSSGSTASGSSSGSTSVSNQQGSNSLSTSVSSDLSVWEGLKSSIEAMLSTRGKVVVSPATGSITVTDTPNVLKEVSSFIKAQNDSMGKQVMITVQVLGVNRRDSDEYSISWDAVYQSLERKYGLTNAVTASPGASSLSLGIVSPSSRWNGTQAIINALSEQGTVHLETTASVVALNNQPAPIQTAKQVTYIARSAVTNTPDVGTSQSVEPGTVASGFSMQVLPSIMADGELILQFSADVSTLREIRRVDVGDIVIEAPEVDTQNFLQRISMKSGETLVLSGFEQTNGNLTYTGVGSPRMPILGGGMNAERRKESVVVLVTPVVINN